ncbi:hypothetical protein pdam_00025689 [Pocillopora damicornis]|uniref:ABC transmembrane type-1 domain-containing protein n=1 Tax=Pocillopora damicornis TaxID=46731 RepID=A0A3M6TUB9_POCDA|nr:hypothetical protein pdam_00025689 [Pocillopora damicornis]
MAMGICGLISIIARNHFGFTCDVLGIGMSTALEGLIYQKFLHLDTKSLCGGKHVLQLNRPDLFKYTTGRVIDLVSNDVQRLKEIAVQLTLLSIVDFSIVMRIVTTLILHFFGWQGLMGVLCLRFLLPYFAVLAHIKATLHRRTAAVSDMRISLLNQVISGIRAIKTHTWEDKYREKIKRIRNDEINLIRKNGAVLSSVATLKYPSVPLAMLLSVITLVSTSRPLTPVQAFMLLYFINVARTCTCFYVPYGFLDANEAYGIEDFLLLRDLPKINHKNPMSGVANANQKIESNLKRTPPYRQENR